MKLGCRMLKIGAIFPPLLAILVGLSLFLRSGREQDLTRRLCAAEMIADETGQIGQATQEYLRRCDAQSEKEWRSRYAFLRRNGIARIETDLSGTAEQTVIESLIYNYECIGQTFESMAEYFKAVQKIGGRDLSETTVTGMIQEMNIRSRAVVANAFRLSQIAQGRAETARAVSDAILIIVSAIVALLMAAWIYAIAHGEITARQEIDQTLRKSDIQLSDAFLKLRRAGEQVARGEKLQAVEQAARSVIHEWRNAVTPIFAATEYLLESVKMLNDDGESSQLLEVVHATTERADKEIDRLQSTLSPKMLRGEAINLNETVESALRASERYWKDRPAWQQIEVRKELNELLPVIGTPTDLADAVANVIENAAEAMLRGGTMVIKTYGVGMWTCISISDSGVGMSPDIQARCFEPFFSTKGTGSAGMGLTLTRGIVHQHHGTIEIDSGIGKGTTVVISLPIGAQAAKTPSASADAKPLFGMKKLRILVMDDEAWSLSLIFGVLKSDGHSVDTAESGKQGLEKFKSNTYDIVLTDLAMPDMGGTEVLSEIKKLDPGMPVIVITGYGDEAKARKETSAADRVLGKPFNLDELRAAIAQTAKVRT